MTLDDEAYEGYIANYGKERKAGDLEEIHTVEGETPTLKTEQGSVCGSVKLERKDFNPIFQMICWDVRPPNKWLVYRYLVDT